MIEREDNYYELTRKFRIDETVAFKGEKIEHPKFTEEMTIIEELGMFFLTNQRLVTLVRKNASTSRSTFSAVLILTASTL